MNDSPYERLREISWRRKLTASEEAGLRAWLASHPEARAEWEAESALNQTLYRLPDVPVPSNFTARVLQDIRRQSTASPRAGWRWFLRSLLPKAAVAGIVLAFGFAAYEKHAAARQRVEMAQSVATVSEVTSLPSPDILQDFDAIRHLNAVRPDDDLLSLMQ